MYINFLILCKNIFVKSVSKNLKKYIVLHLLGFHRDKIPISNQSINSLIKKEYLYKEEGTFIVGFKNTLKARILKIADLWLTSNVSIAFG